MLAFVELVSHAAMRALGARSVFIDTSVARVHAYELRGKGRGTFVLLHGMGTTSSAYLRVAIDLAKHAERVVLPDLPSHGRSQSLGGSLDRERLRTGMREALDALIHPREPAVVLGTSLGGATALGYTLERPERVRALVLASPAGAPLDAEELAAIRRRFKLESRADARRFFSELLHEPPLAFVLLEPGLVKQLSSATVQGFLGSLSEADFFTAAELGTIRCPVHVVWGESDRILPRSGLAFLKRALPPETSFDEPRALGHSPHLERPKLLVDALLRARERATGQSSMTGG
ncbi:MAG: alpha/beta hydrolase [Polyangiaceae bacterium]